MNEAQVIATVEEHLNRHQPSAFHLNLIREGVRHDGDWWYLVVLPDPPDVRAYDYDQIMARVEDEIEDQEHIKVLLVPAMPD